MGDDGILNRLYHDPSQPGSYGGVRPLYKEAKKVLPHLTIQQTQNFLTGVDAYTRHAPARRRFPRNRIVVREVDELWQCDLSDLTSLHTHNDGYRYLLTCVDGLSKFLWCIPLKDKHPSSVTAGLRQIFSSSGRTPWKLQTDKGGEFNNRSVKSFLQDQDIHYFTTQNEDVKAAFVERVQRTLKEKMWRYFSANHTFRYMDVLPQLLHAYNHTVHSRTKFAPSLVTRDNQKEVYQNLFGKEKKLQVRSKPYKAGDTVRLSIRKDRFEKGYTPNWTQELFTVHQTIPRRPHPVFAVKDFNNQVLVGKFYAPELQTVRKPADNVYRVEKILKTRRRGRHAPLEYLVRWAGYPPSFDSWTTEIVS